MCSRALLAPPLVRIWDLASREVVLSQARWGAGIPVDRRESAPGAIPTSCCAKLVRSIWRDE
jgi:hypothetical protein